MTEKIVRGITFREDGAFIEPGEKIQSFVVNDEDVKDVKEMLDRAARCSRENPALSFEGRGLKAATCTKSHSGIS